MREQLGEQAAKLETAENEILRMKAVMATGREKAVATKGKTHTHTHGVSDRDPSVNPVAFLRVLCRLMGSM